MYRIKTFTNIETGVDSSFLIQKKKDGKYFGLICKKLPLVYTDKKHANKVKLWLEDNSDNHDYPDFIFEGIDKEWVKNL